MTDQSISPLRRRMTFLRPPKRTSRRRAEDMTIRKVAPKTQASYIRAVKNFTVFLGRSPDSASAEDLWRYQLHLASGGVSVPSLNALCCLWTNAADSAIVTTYRFVYRQRSKHTYVGRRQCISPETLGGFSFCR